MLLLTGGLFKESGSIPSYVMDRKRPADGDIPSVEPTTKLSKGKNKYKSNTISSKTKLNMQLQDAKLQKKFTQLYEGNNDMHVEDNGSISLYQTPFKHCVLPGFIDDEDNFLEKLQDELLFLSFVEKNNDLYKFHQSKEDLKMAQTPCISTLRNLIFVTFKEWLQNVTKIPLNDTIDMSCAKYEFSDTLLCHDDELEGRRIAFIYYLVPTDWSEEDGGALDLYTVDGHGQPSNVVKSILPERNNFVFFEVTPVSFHQVAEVLAEDKTRLSISGWFHGPPIQRPKPYVEPPSSTSEMKLIGEEEFYEWINPMYLNMMTQSDIRERFEEESEIELTDFLKTNKYEELKAALQATDKWQHRGPPNKRSYYRLGMEGVPQIVQDCVKFLQSDALFLVLSNLTGLKLHELAPHSDEEDEESSKEADDDSEKNPSCCSEIRRWSHGCYTLVHDTDCETVDFALDSMLYIGSEGWEPEFGGTTSYISKGEDEELLSVGPSENCLALVYRGEDTLHFVKHLNSSCNKMPHKEFYDISTVYYE